MLYGLWSSGGGNDTYCTDYVYVGADRVARSLDVYIHRAEWGEGSDYTLIRAKSRNAVREEAYHLRCTEAGRMPVGARRMLPEIAKRIVEELDLSEVDEIAIQHLHTIAAELPTTA